MRVAVFGPGALGCLFAARLHAAGHDAVLVDHKEERAARLIASGIRVDAADGGIHARIPVVTRCPGPCDLTLVLVKSGATANVAPPPGAPVLTLQNGLGNAELLMERISPALVLAGATTEAATLLEEGHTRHVAAGLTTFGAMTTCPVAAVRNILDSAGFRIELAREPRRVLWEKVIVSAALNPLTALLAVENGRVPGAPPARRLMRELAREAWLVAQADGCAIAESILDRPEAVANLTAANHSSMLQDLQAGRPTEIEAISGEIARRAMVHGVPTPYTHAILELVRAAALFRERDSLLAGYRE